ncbi:hypothetical protein [Streptosporangium sp. LJ11]|uniref:hypothetical protein n=1 Tax=Streptosporangium sp. LJ11 TaxID=3436927 RepID=UPI003F7980BF
MLPISASVEGISVAPAIPSSARAAISASALGAYAAATDARPNAAAPHIRNLLAAGLSTATIAGLLPCMGKDGDALIADCPELLLDLHRERARLQAAIHELETARTTLDAVIATAPPEAERTARAMLAPAS